MTLKIAVTSDNHGKLTSHPWPKADILVFAGDSLPTFSFIKSESANSQLNYLRDKFNPLLGELRRKYKEII